MLSNAFEARNCASLSHFARNIVLIVGAAMALTACGSDDRTAVFEPDPEPTPVTITPEAEWVVAQNDGVDKLLIDADTGDILVRAIGEVRRITADGEELFRLAMPNSLSLGDVALGADGGAILLVRCSGDTVVSGTQIACPTPSEMLVELGRTGSVARWKAFASNPDWTILPRTLAVGDDGRAHVAGTIEAAMSFGEITLEPATAGGLFYLQLDADWDPRVAREYGGRPIDYEVAIDPASGDVFVIGSFTGQLRLSGINLLSGPNGTAIFLYRMSEDAEPRWAKHFSGVGRFRARFVDEGDLAIEGHGRAPFTSLGGDGVIDGPVATRLSGDGSHVWTWRTQDRASVGDAVLHDGRVIAAFTEAVIVREAYEPPMDCFGTFTPDCQSAPAVSIYERVLSISDVDGGELGRVLLGASDRHEGFSLIAPAPDGTVIVADRVIGEGYGYEQPTTLSKYRLVPSDG